MKIMQRYVIDYAPRTIEILNTHCVEYNPKLRDITIFDISSDHECIMDLKTIVSNLKPLYSYYVFSDEEMNEAEWFTMRSTNRKLENVLEEKTFDFSCKYIQQVNTRIPNKPRIPNTPWDDYFMEVDEVFYAHETQVAPYYFSKKIKWGRNFFYSVLRRGAQDFFCNEIAKNIISNNGLKGVSFLPPLRKQTNEPIEDAYQFIIDNTLPESSCDVVGYRDIYYCPVCGKKEYYIDALSRARVKKSALGDHDFYASEPLFVGGDGWIIPNRFSIISHRAYEVFKASGFTRTLELTPLITY